MCAGAIINARIPRVVYGAPDAKAGSCGSLTNLFALPYNHRPAVTAGRWLYGRANRSVSVPHEPAFGSAAP